MLIKYKIKDKILIYFMQISINCDLSLEMHLLINNSDFHDARKKQT